MVPLPVDITINDMIRFWAKVDRGGPDDCWPWVGCLKTDHDAYGCQTEQRGYFMWAGYSYVAARVAYYLHHRNDPGDLLVCHTCDNPVCVNFAHLVLGTKSDNRHDVFDRNRYSHRGSRNTNAVLTEEMIPGIRLRLAKGEKRSEIARSLGVHYHTIRDIETGRRWSHVP